MIHMYKTRIFCTLRNRSKILQEVAISSCTPSAAPCSKVHVKNLHFLVYKIYWNSGLEQEKVNSVDCKERKTWILFL